MPVQWPPARRGARFRRIAHTLQGGPKTATDRPRAPACARRAGYLMPLPVCQGAAEAAGLTGSRVYRDRVMGFMTAGDRWTEAGSDSRAYQRGE